MLNGVIFDFNGTLFFDSEYHFEVFNELKKELTGQSLTMREMESTYAGKPNVEIFSLMSNGVLTREQCEAYSKRKEAMYRQKVRESEDAKLCNGAIELFNLLKQNNIPFTIASASIKENIDFFIETFHLDQWIDTNNIVYDDGSYKDKVNMFKDAIKKLHVKDHIIIFEDSLSGIKCGSKVGARLIIIDRETLRPFYKDYPNIIQTVDDLSEAIETIKELIHDQDS